MDAMKVLLYSALFLCCTSQVLSSCTCNESHSFCSTTGDLQLTAFVHGVPGLNGSKGEPGQNGTEGDAGPKGEPGMPGQKGIPGENGSKGNCGKVGRPGASGPKGEPSMSGLNGVPGEKGSQGHSGHVGRPGAAGLKGGKGEPGNITKIRSEFTMCDTFSPAWRRVVYINMADAAVECPRGLHNVSEGNKTACSGMSVDNNCTSLTFPTGWSYTHVCGRVRGYMLGNKTRGIILDRANDTDTHYADGVLITTSGSPREHLWTYAVGMDDTHCPCKFRGIFLPDNKLEHQYCEYERFGWDEPLWNEARCGTNPCCKRQGWFHRRVQHFTDNIEVRWCGFEKDDFATDLVEIWVQ